MEVEIWTFEMEAEILNFILANASHNRHQSVIM